MCGYLEVPAMLCCGLVGLFCGFLTSGLNIPLMPGRKRPSFSLPSASMEYYFYNTSTRCNIYDLKHYIVFDLR